MLRAPKGAGEDKALRGDDGWLKVRDFLARFPDEDDRRRLGQKLTDYGLRHIAARGWTTPDGTRTRIQLLQFATAAVVDDLMSGGPAGSAAPVHPVRGADAYDLDVMFPYKARIKDLTLTPYAEVEPYGAEQVRQAYVGAGDTIAVITQSRRGGANPVPFRQTVTLRSELLARGTSSGGPGSGRVSWGPALSSAHPRSRSTRGSLLRNPAGPGLRRRARLRRSDREEAVPGSALTLSQESCHS